MTLDYRTEHATQGEAMTDWTPEKLDALPEGTVITAAQRASTPDLFIGLDNDEARDWIGIFRDSETSAWLTDPANVDPASIHVVSVPIDALLSDDAIEAARWHSGLGGNRYGIERILRAAIGHVTGGAA